MHNVQWCRIGTKFKYKQFCGCFDFQVTEELLQRIIAGGFFTEEITDKRAKSKKKITGYTNNRLHIRNEHDYIYLNYANKDEIAYTFNTTLENNRLNLCQVAEEVIPDLKSRYCSVCGAAYFPNSNKQIYCGDCKEKITAERALFRKRKQRFIAKYGADQCGGDCDKCTQCECLNYKQE